MRDDLRLRNLQASVGFRTMPEDPRAFLKRMAEQRAKQEFAAKAKCQEQATALFENLEGHHVGFYPGCGSDFNYPLKRFVDRCDTFVFCDWLSGGWGGDMAFSNWIDSMGEFTVTADASLPDETVRQLAEMDEEWANAVGFVVADARPEMREYLATRPKPQGHYFKIQVGSAKLDVFLIAAEATCLYLKLFAKRGAAPRILCLKNWGHIGGEWTPFGNWQAHLASAVRAGGVVPELLVAREGDHDWPWPVQVDRFEDWGDRPVIMWKRKPGTLHIAEKGKRQPLPKGKLRDPWRKKHVKPGALPGPKPTHHLALLATLKTKKK